LASNYLVFAKRNPVTAGLSLPISRPR
jgi:hypothetical protein